MDYDDNYCADFIFECKQAHKISKAIQHAFFAPKKNINLWCAETPCFPGNFIYAYYIHYDAELAAIH